MNHPFKDLSVDDADAIERILRRAAGLTKGQYRTSWAWHWNAAGNWDLLLHDQIGGPAAISMTTKKE